MATSSLGSLSCFAHDRQCVDGRDRRSNVNLFIPPLFGPLSSMMYFVTCFNTMQQVGFYPMLRRCWLRCASWRGRVGGFAAMPFHFPPHHSLCGASQHHSRIGGLEVEARGGVGAEERRVEGCLVGSTQLEAWCR